ncbi:MgtC/SapB family protein [Haliea sp. E1-2-M8]|uniref:MgtC/SapB family protein n=1 Tax=Haliea sp. E1-2-M8 TaxID=3064706 RepID=UPI0027165BAB|nr:MgtC/SapB family protein [Haliea sp. E1-2-M8]MDO8860098.1 MgtC/SapB family protein [Haliea sp. E1-2-M8]
METADYSHLLSQFSSLAMALGIGLLVGSERGWHHRGHSEGGRVAGIRTFTLVALLGGVVAVVAQALVPGRAALICALVFIPLGLLLTAGYVQESRRDGDVSITTAVAAMATYWLGTMPAFALALPAAASAVLLTLLLHQKETLHRWVEVLDRQELTGTLQFLVVSVVVLPLLPDQDFGPWGALNPWRLWWMVVLISGLSLAGYFAMRLAGTRRGILVTSLAGGLASSTAVTISLSRLHQHDSQTRLLSAGILIACSTMFSRVLVVIFVLKRELLLPALLPLGGGMLLLLGVALWQLRHSGEGEVKPPNVSNPFQLLPALQFGALLAVVMVAVEGLLDWFGEQGLYLLSIVTGIADVDPIVLSLAPKADAELSTALVLMCVCLAAATNTVMKGIYCRILGGAKLGNRVLLPAIACATFVIGLAAAVTALR